MKYIGALIASLLLLPWPAVAANEFLYFRLNSAGEVEAVVAGVLDNACPFQFVPPTSITVTGTSIAIVSPNVIPPPCFMPVPPYDYQVIANLGVLAAPVYTVSWTQGPFVLNAQLTLVNLSPRQVPTLRGGALLILVLTCALLGVADPHRRVRMWRRDA